MQTFRTLPIISEHRGLCEGRIYGCAVVFMCNGILWKCPGWCWVCRWTDDRRQILFVMQHHLLAQWRTANTTVTAKGWDRRGKPQNKWTFNSRVHWNTPRDVKRYIHWSASPKHGNDSFKDDSPENNETNTHTRENTITNDCVCVCVFSVCFLFWDELFDAQRTVGRWQTET